jgi:AcrR family transcriptional regulator
VLRERILDAAASLFTGRGLSRTTVDDIAAAADVSRATLYRLFRSRDEIAMSVLLREIDLVAGQLLAHVGSKTSIDEVLVEGIVAAVRTVRDNPRLSVLFAPDAAGLMARTAVDSEALFMRIRSFGRILLEQPDGTRRPGIRPDLGTDEIADHLARIVLALLVLPSADLRSEDDQRRYMHRFIVPAIVSG